MTYRTTLLIAAMTVLLSGCVKTLDQMTTGRIDGYTYSLGKSYRAQRDTQKLDPTPADYTPVTGLDAASATRAMKKHTAPDSSETTPGFANMVEKIMQDKK